MADTEDSMFLSGCMPNPYYTHS